MDFLSLPIAADAAVHLICFWVMGWSSRDVLADTQVFAVNLLPSVHSEQSAGERLPHSNNLSL